MIEPHRLAAREGKLYLPELEEDRDYFAEHHDGAVRIFISADREDAFLDRHESCSLAHIQTYIEDMARLGYSPMDWQEEGVQITVEDGFLRWYFEQTNAYEDYFDMPSLTGVGYGPYSMEIPVISSEMISESYVNADTGPITLPLYERPSPRPRPHTTVIETKSTTRYEQTTTGPRRRGRHRKNP